MSKPWGMKREGRSLLRLTDVKGPGKESKNENMV